MLNGDQKARIEASKQPDIRPIVAIFYSNFRSLGVSPMVAAEVAVSLVIDDIHRLIIVAGLDIQILQRLEILDDILRQATVSKSVCNGMRIAMILNIATGALGSLWFAFAIARFFQLI